MLRVLTKIVVGIVLFYLVAGFILIPLVLWWAIPSQGTKFLKQPVHVRFVTFNPILLQLNIKGFEILNAQKQVMVGFDRLFVDVSFLNLFKKVIRVEAIELDGLKVNATLFAGGHMDLLDLVPANTSLPEKKSAASSATPVALPAVIIDSIALHQGNIHFTDQTLLPNFFTTLDNIEVHITNISTNPETEAKVIFQANLDEKGKISTEAILKPLAKPLQLEATCTLNDYAMQVLTPYTGKYTGHQLKDGKLDFRMDYRIGDNKLTASHKLLIQRFEFGQKVESKDALPLPFGLAVALLEDPQGHIDIALPVTGDMSDPKFEYFHLIGQVVRNFFMKIVTKPFSILASMLGASDNGTDELSYVRFLPGKVDLSDAEKQKLITLVKGLKQRPKLRLQINGTYDPQVDWKAVQADVFTKDYEELRKKSSRSEGKVYQQLYQRRFGIRALWALAKKYKEGVGAYNDEKLDQEIKRQLIENAPPDQGALSVLAQARSQMVQDILVSCGFDTQRLSMGQPHTTQSSMGYVPLEFTLTVFEKS